MRENGVFECDKCGTKFPIIPDKVITGICGDCYELYNLTLKEKERQLDEVRLSEEFQRMSARDIIKKIREENTIDLTEKGAKDA